jgi:hypothetical protein
MIPLLLLIEGAQSDSLRSRLPKYPYQTNAAFTSGLDNTTSDQTPAAIPRQQQGVVQGITARIETTMQKP